MDHTGLALFTLLLASAWASGLNVYALLLVLGIGGLTDAILLPEALEFLQNPLVLIAVGFMYIVEFGADKIPGIDTGWDVLHTFIRIPAGAFIAAAFMSDMHPDWVPVAYFIGGMLALFSHAAKSSSRLLINTSPEPFSNWGASVAEDVLVFAGLWLAITHPIIFLLLLAGFIALLIWLVPKIIRALISIFAAIGRWFSGRSASQA